MVWLCELGIVPQTKKFARWIPGPQTCLGCRPGPQMGVCKKQSIDISLAYRYFFPSLCPSLPRSLKTYKILKKKKKKKASFCILGTFTSLPTKKIVAVKTVCLILVLTSPYCREMNSSKDISILH